MKHINILLERIDLPLAPRMMLQNSLQANNRIATMPAEPDIVVLTQSIALVINHPGSIILKHGIHKPMETM